MPPAPARILLERQRRFEPASNQGVDMTNARHLKVTTPLLALLAACSGPPAPAPAQTRAYVEADPGPDVCGDGARTGAEQCDDGNVVNLDGCDSACRFEQSHRANALTMQFATDTNC